MGGEAYIHARLVALAAAAGCVDAATYLGLSGVFVANQTGNTVLMGIAVSQGDWAQVARAGIALGTFCLGVLTAASALRGAASGWPRRVTAVVAVQAVLLGVLSAAWGPLPTLAGIALGGLVLGAQSAATLHIGIGWPTTFVTGTLTRIFTEVGQRTRAFGPRWAVLTWAAYLFGAVVGGLLERAVDARLAVAVAAVATALVALSAWPRAAP
jgi:uncharacterized membrane protein YoaK (UPF0700 family)